jgi:hypothetical protein
MEMGERPPTPAPIVVAGGRDEHRTHMLLCAMVDVASDATHAMLPPLPPVV